MPDSSAGGGGNSYGPIEIDRRTLTKLTGMAGVTLVAPQVVSDRVEANSNGTTAVMNIKPTFNYVLVQSNELEDTTASGIILPRNTDFQVGIVRALGDEVTHVGERDTVLYVGPGDEITIAGEDHYIISEDQIQSVVEL